MATTVPTGATTLDESAVQGLTASMRGSLIRRGDPGYDEERIVYNAMIAKHPALITQCATISLVGCRSEEAGQVRPDDEPRVERITRRIGRDFGGIAGQSLAPDQPRGQALLHDRFEDAAKDH